MLAGIGSLEEADLIDDDIHDAGEDCRHLAGGPRQCGKGHRSTLLLPTSEGGVICLACLSALLSDPFSPAHHLSYALSQLSAATRDPAFLRGLLTCHPHLLVGPLVRALSSTSDEPLARQIIDLVSDISGSGSVSGDFITRISDLLSSGALAWSRQQIYTLHCFGVLLESHQGGNPAEHIRDKAALFANLIVGLQLPSEESRGEILFVLYKFFVCEAMLGDDCGDHSNGLLSAANVSQLLRLALEALLKSQHDEVRMNCIALLTVLARRGLLEDSFSNDQMWISSRGEDSLMQMEDEAPHIPLINLFADAIKGPLLSSNIQVQIGTLDLVFHSFSSNMSCNRQIQILVEENTADYVFEILRLSGNKDPVVISCLQVLDLLATAEDSFRQRLAIGFPTLLSILLYIVEIPLHPVQGQVFKLLCSCISDCPGIVSFSQGEEIAFVLTGFFRRHANGELDIPAETFSTACSTFAEILKSPSARNSQKLLSLTQEASKNAVLSSISSHRGNYDSYLLYSLYLLKEAHVYCHENKGSVCEDLEKSIADICEAYLLPWLETDTDQIKEEEAVMGVLEIFHLVLLGGSEVQAHEFAEMLSSSCWFTLSFGFLGMFPSDSMKSRVYLMLSSVVDRIFGSDIGEPIRDAFINLPLDPIELIFLLGQNGSQDPNLISCQRAIILILYVSSLCGERLADENQVLASLEQYILVNSTSFTCGIGDSRMLTQLIYLYAFLRGSYVGYRSPYSLEAEKALFNLAIEKDWDMQSVGVHLIALKWLFQQELLVELMSYQMLKFCRSYRDKGQVIVYSRRMQMMDIQMIAELAVAGDNYLTSLLSSLLENAKEYGREDDLLSILDVISAVLNVNPNSSDQFCLHGINDALYHVYCTADCSSQIFATCLLLIFNILYLANSNAVSEDGSWPAITFKLLQFLNPKLSSCSCGSDEHLMIGILCLILHHSTNGAFKEASSAILFNTSLISTVHGMIRKACAKGPALVDHDEETSMGESLIFVLLLYFYSLKSLQALLPGTMDWQDFLRTSDDVQPLKVMHIQSDDLCRLMYYGSSLVKLVTSQCLVQLFYSISDQRTEPNELLKCSARYLKSMMAVIEGLLLYGEHTVAVNCGICLSIILGWEKSELQDKRAIKGSKWCRLVMEELALTLAAPSSGSRCISNQHKAATYVAVALLRKDQVPEWFESLFDSSCISGIINNLTASNVSLEMVMMFRALMAKKYLNREQITHLHNLFQVCRKHVYKHGATDRCEEKCIKKVVSMPDDIGAVCSLLINLMLSPSRDYDEIPPKNKKLLDEMEIFLQESSKH